MIIVINSFIFTSCWKSLCDVVVKSLISRAKLWLISASPDIVHDCRKMRNLPEIFLRSFENVGLGLLRLVISRPTPRLLSFALCLEWINGTYNTIHSRHSRHCTHWLVVCSAIDCTVQWTRTRRQSIQSNCRNIPEIRTRCRENNK